MREGESKGEEIKAVRVRDPHKGFDEVRTRSGEEWLGCWDWGEGCCNSWKHVKRRWMSSEWGTRESVCVNVSMSLCLSISLHLTVCQGEREEEVERDSSNERGQTLSE